LEDRVICGALAGFHTVWPRLLSACGEEGLFVFDRNLEWVTPFWRGGCVRSRRDQARRATGEYHL
jgi:hypothetical protein